MELVEMKTVLLTDQVTLVNVEDMVLLLLQLAQQVEEMEEMEEIFMLFPIKIFILYTMYAIIEYIMLKMAIKAHQIPKLVEMATIL